MLPPHASPVERFAYYGVRVAAAIMLFLLVVPILIIIPLSFTSGTLLIYPMPGFSLRWYQNFFADPLWVGALKNSLFIAVIVTCIATPLGTLAALGLTRLDSRLKPILLGLFATPILVPVIIFGVSSFYLFAYFGLAGTFPGLIMAHTVGSLPFVVITVLATLQGFDHNMIRAGAISGASPTEVFFRITLPLILPGVVSGAIFAFVHSFDELIVTIFLASPQQRTLPRQIWAGVVEDISPTLTAAAVILMVVSLALMVVIELLRRRGARLRGES